MNYIYIILPIGCFALNALFQVIIARSLKLLGLLKAIIIGFGIGITLLIVIEFLLADTFNSVFANILTYSCLGYCYFHFVNLGETARRIRILRELADSRQGLSIEGLLKVYNSKEILDKRIARLVKNGQIKYSDGRYYIGKPIMLLFAKIIIAMKLFILGKKSEFD